MSVYRILYNGYGANRSLYREQELRLDTPHDWSRKNDSDKVLFLIHQKLHEHFSKYDILLIEKIS